ncbi:adhesin transport system membrane fusion protein [Litoreibacter ponti]|uniref:Membrane fusion protein (MFP) family protein n=2 Tax=Litoreibacter ponti TaxID=1510457 RepID=A0A2T6BM04_9RHOB|nr:adhesin transport system membrane fusion protein [Litoreibacter ponti]
MQGPNASRTARLTVRVSALMIGLALLWAHLTELPEVAFASGTIEPSGSLRRIEHLDGGVVEKILVREGEVINLEQPLALLAEDDVEAEYERFRAREAILNLALNRTLEILTAIGFSGNADPSPVNGGLRVTAQLAAYNAKRIRLKARIESAEGRIASQQAVLDALETRIAIEAAELGRAENLVRAGLTTLRQLTEYERRHAEIKGDVVRARAALVEAQANKQDAERALSEFFTTTRDTLYADLEATSEELSLLQRAIVENRLRVDRLTITTPVTGVVQAMYVNSQNEVLEPGGLVAEILPTSDRLIAELHLKPRDIGHITVGDPVEIKLTTFNTKKFGVLAGWVAQISATSTRNEQLETYFKVKVDLGQDWVGENGEFLAIKAGMEVNASIITGTRTVLDYVLNPLFDPFQRAFGER